jgi:hypothetical protein
VPVEEEEEEEEGGGGEEEEEEEEVGFIIRIFHHERSHECKEKLWMYLCTVILCNISTEIRQKHIT